MEALLSRYRNLTVLLVVIVAQVLYLAYQVKSNRDERLIRVWAVSAVTPMAGVVEAVRRNTIGFLQDYFILLDVREQNRKLRAENNHLRLENIYFRNQLATAEHARALVMFQAQTRSKTVAARVIGNSTVVTAKAVFVDRGSTSGIEKGMAVVTPEGIVGKVVAVYPLVSQVLLVTDPTFKVGVESQKNHVHGVLDCGQGTCQVQQIQNEEGVDVGEWFFTSGEDRVFPKGFPVGTVSSSQPGQEMKQIRLALSAAPGGADEVLVVLHGVHQELPTVPPVQQASIRSLEPPPEIETGNTPVARPQTEADRILDKYQTIGKQQDHVYGGYGSGIPNFNPKSAGTETQPKTPRAVPAQSTPSPASPDQENRIPAQQVPANRPARVLGARPDLIPPEPRLTTPPNHIAPDGGPPLPLGAPRRKGPAPMDSGAKEQSTTQQQRPPTQE